MNKQTTPDWSCGTSSKPAFLCVTAEWLKLMESLSAWFGKPKTCVAALLKIAAGGFWKDFAMFPTEVGATESENESRWKEPSSRNLLCDFLEPTAGFTKEVQVMASVIRRRWMQRVQSMKLMKKVSCTELKASEWRDLSQFRKNTNKCKSEASLH